LQQQAQQNGQRVLSIDLTASMNGEAATGVLLLPFGLALDTGVTLRIDDQAPGKPLRFSTCIPAGCVIPLSFDAAYMAALRKGKSLNIAAAASQSNQPVQLAVSLKGMSAAFDRVVARAP
jgi:invasion protein IalB